jgi:hypothetical protein
MLGAAMNKQPDTSKEKSQIHSANNFFGAHMNMIPLQNSVQGARMFYGSKFVNQAFPLREPEVPWVQNAVDHDEQGRSFDDILGKFGGSVSSDDEGVVMDVTPDNITLKLTDGTKKKIGLYNNFPLNRKTAIHNTALVKKGDPVTKGQMLAKSNYTNDSGTLALGTNARTALVPYRGYSMEDAIVVSESFAKKLTAETMYTDSMDYKRGVKGGLGHYKGIFPNKFTNKQLESLTEEGVARPGTIVNKGDPILLATKPRSVSSANQRLGNLSKHMKNARTDASLVWDMNDPGEVTDVVKTKHGYKVSVKSYTPANTGDKIVYRSGQKSFHPDTELLTERGWVKVSELQKSDLVAALFDEAPEPFVEGNGRRLRAAQELIARFVPILDAHTYEYDGDLYELDAQNVAYSVTPTHRIWRKGHTRGCSRWSIQDAQEVHGGTHSFMVRSKFDLSKRCDPEYFVLPRVISNKTGKAMDCITTIPFQAYIKFMALYLADGNIRHHRECDYSIVITKKEGDFSDEVESILDSCGLPWKKINNQYVTNSQKALSTYLKRFGKAPDKFIPNEIKLASQEAIAEFLRIYWMTDGDKEKQTQFYTTSKKMADDLQHLLALAGKAGSISIRPPREHQNYTNYTIHVISHKEVGTRKNYKQAFSLNPYKGSVYCIQVSGVGVVLSRFRGKSFWIGNSVISDTREKME